MDKKVTDERLKKDSETLVYLLDEACDFQNGFLGLTEHSQSRCSY